ncbi:MAG: 23S rRNA (adenine(2503)-C(2))-methyltransferase RlmN [Desulfatitalea sp.]|nr:23S rRNA (adenine(2503)-C(2))-methyltransferase RlmN [Desulfatitalea sp.]
MALTYAELAMVFRQRYDRGGYHAAAFYRAFFAGGPDHWKALPAFTASPRLAQSVAADLRHRPLTCLRREEQEGAIKLVFALADGMSVETVVIPMAHHTTVCISCQVGCRMGCGFCETGQMGLLRHLTPDEMVGQLHAVKVGLGMDVRNVVFMGMGEPLDNFDNVIQAIRVLSDQRGLNVALRRITLSTAGVVPGIQRLTALGWPQLKLAVSLNAAEETLRSTLMPINRRYGLSSLKAALAGYPLARGNVLLVEYVLMRGINDQEAHADQVAAFLDGLSARLNLIPYNPRYRSPYQAPTETDIHRFQQALIHRNVFVRLRSSKGAGMRAACGQLGVACNSRRRD